MIKANKKKIEIEQYPEPIDLKTVADYLTKAGDTGKIEMREKIEYIKQNMESDENTITRRQRDIDDLKERRERDEVALAETEKELAEMPTAKIYTEDEARADIEKALRLPFIKSVRIENMGEREYIVATTRENTLYTTINRKYSRGQRWYKSKPYKIALPAYNIRIGTIPSKTHANNSEVLGLALANYREDTAHWLDWATRYYQHIYPHWGTTSVGRDGDGRGTYRGICLGEYEGEVSTSFRRSIAEGLTALAVYLQTSGTESAYIHGRHLWALMLGKKEYNKALVPSEREEVKLEEEGEEEDGGLCGDCSDRHGDRVCGHDCECQCHNND